MTLPLLPILLLFQPSADTGAPASESPATTAGADPTTTEAAAVTVTGKTTEPAVDITTEVFNQVSLTINQTPWIGWVLLFCGILGGLIVGKIAQNVLRGMGNRLAEHGWVARGSLFNFASGPVSLAFIAAGLAVGTTGVVMDTSVRTFVGKGIGLMCVIALGWFLYNLVEIIEIGIRRITADNTILQLIRKALRIFVLVVFGLFVAQNFFGAEIGAWLAGLGLAGLAVSLAAQGPIKNLFGSVTVVLDRPFGLGDRIKFADKVGVVEVMGFRSTKLRTMEGHLVTIPNSKLIEDVVENISARPHIRRTMDVTITYDTPPEKVELALNIIKDLLAEPFMAETFNLETSPPRVAFNQFNADSLNIAVSYWYQLNVEGRDWWTFNGQAQEFNLKLLRAYNAAGISFAFPTQTVYLAGDAERQLSIQLLPQNGSLPNGSAAHSRTSVVS